MRRGAANASDIDARQAGCPVDADRRQRSGESRSGRQDHGDFLDIYKENCGPLSVDAEFGYALTQVGSGADNADIAAGRREALRLLNAVGRERWCSHTRDSELMQKVEALSRAQSNRFRRGERRPRSARPSLEPSVKPRLIGRA